MDGLFLVGFLVTIFVCLVVPIMVFLLLGRVKQLESQVRKVEAELEARRNLVPRQGVEGTKETSGGSVMARAMEKAKDGTREDGEDAVEEGQSPRVMPPPLPPRSALSAELPNRAVMPEGSLPKAAEPGPLAKVSHPFGEWLEKVGLKPPRADEEGANLIAWWSTRAGLGLGVIAAVFFGMYVNQNTVPLVRLLELVAVAMGLFAAGFWIEKKLGAFGRALSAGGLGLLYVAAFASYGLPAMKVIETPLIGSLVQVGAVILMAGWALWRRNEGVFGLALTLGYVTSWFSYREGVEPLPLISLLVLGLGGAALFAHRGWWSGLWAGLVGSAGGISMLALFKWLPDGGPSDFVGLGSACLLTVILVGGFYLRWRKAGPLAHAMLPLITSAGVLVGAVVTWTLGIEWEWYYGVYALLLLVVGALWRRESEGESMWEVMWGKASVLLALFIIAKFEGPVRAYGLLAQAGSLAFLARRKGWLVFDLGALLAILTGWVYVRRELSLEMVSIWGLPELVVLGFLFGVLGMLAYFGRGGAAPELREKVVTGLVALVALAVVWVSVWRVDHDWAILAALIGAMLFLGVGRVAKIWQADLLAVIFLMPSLFLLAGRGVNMQGGHLGVEGVAWQLLTWLVAAWSYGGWLGRERSIARRLVGGGVMLGSIGAVVLMGSEFFGVEWNLVVLLGLALAWLVADQRIAIPDLKLLSVVPWLMAGLLMLDHWDGEMRSGVLAFAVLGAVAYWGHDLLVVRGEKVVFFGSLYDGLRGLVLGVVLLTALNLRFEGTGEVLLAAALSTLMIGLWWRLKDAPSSWIGLASAGLALKVLLEHRERDSWHGWTVAALFVILVVNGLILARSGRSNSLSNPKAASVIWGALALIAVLVGLVLEGETAGWTTAGWALGAVSLLAAGFWGGLRGYRVLGLAGIGGAILRLFVVDLDETFWRIVAFGVTGALLVGIGYIYNRFHQRLAEQDLDWRKV